VNREQKIEMDPSGADRAGPGASRRKCIAGMQDEWNHRAAAAGELDLRAPASRTLPNGNAFLNQPGISPVFFLIVARKNSPEFRLIFWILPAAVMIFPLGVPFVSGGQKLHG
jgi:hypothetical protein